MAVPVTKDQRNLERQELRNHVAAKAGSEQDQLFDSIDSQRLSPEMKSFLNDTRLKLKGCERRKFMANVVQLLGKGGQLRAERELGWDRKTIRKGIRELTSGFDCVDNYTGGKGLVGT